MITTFHHSCTHQKLLSSEKFIQRSSVKKVFLKFLQNSQEKNLSSLFFNKVAGSTLLKKSLWHRCFPVNFTKFLRTHFFIEHLWWLLLLVAMPATEMLVCATLFCHSVFTRLFPANSFFFILLLTVLHLKVNLQPIFYEPDYCWFPLNTRFSH